MKYTHPCANNPCKPVLSEGEHSGFQWAVLHNNLGYRCGYVAVPPGHPWHGKDYDDILAEVHGGLTYTESNPNDGSHWVGFDCAPSGDAQDPSLPARYPARELRGWEVIRTQEYVESECKNLCEQAAKATGKEGL